MSSLLMIMVVLLAVAFYCLLTARGASQEYAIGQQYAERRAKAEQSNHIQRAGPRAE